MVLEAGRLGSGCLRGCFLVNAPLWLMEGLPSPCAHVTCACVHVRVQGGQGREGASPLMPPLPRALTAPGGPAT